MKKIDQYLLNVSQAVSDWFQSWFGADNFFLAKVFIAISTLSVILSGFIRMSDPTNLVGTLISLVCQAIVLTAFLPMVLFAEQSCKRNPKFRNPYERALMFLRIINIFFALTSMFVFVYAMLARYFPGLNTNIPVPEMFMFLGAKNLTSSQLDVCGFLSVVQMWAMLIFLYFGSCTPKPPEQGRLAKWLERISPQPTVQ